MKLKEFRQKLGYSQHQISIDLDIPEQTLYGWENKSRQPSIENLIKLADYFHTTLDELVGRESDMINLNCLEEDDAYIIKKLLQMNQMEKLRTKAFIMGLTE